MRQSLIVPSLVVLVSQFLTAQSYKATALQHLPGGKEAYTYGAAVNNSGITAGTCSVPNARDACTWSADGTPTDLGTLGGDDAVSFAINNGGQVVGYSNTADNSQRAFLWTPGAGMQALPSLGQGVQDGAYAINDSGQVVGYSCLDTPYCQGNYHAFLWSQSAGIQDLGTLPNGTMTFANGINAHGHVVGWANLADGSRRSFIWTAASGLQELAPGSGLDNYYAEAINDADQVVGSFYDHADNQYHAYVWTQSAGIQDMGTNGQVFSINDAGNFVGYANGTAALWLNGVYQNLSLAVQPHNPTFVRLGSSINAIGQIVASSGKKSYLLTPITTIALTSSQNPSSHGQPVTFTATVSSIMGAPPDGEQISFLAGSKLLGKGTLAKGVANFTTASLKAGTHTIKASYPGDANFTLSKSSALKQVVQ